MTGRFEEKDTEYEGIKSITGTGADGKPEEIFYAWYRKDGKRYHEKIGRARQDKMNAFRASRIRISRIEGRSEPNVVRREREEREKTEAEGRWTIGKLWTEYLSQNSDIKGIASDKSRWTVWLKDDFGEKEPGELVALDVDRLRMRVLKKRTPATARKALELLRRIINFGVKRGLVPLLSFQITLPAENNQKTEDLNAEQMAKLLKILRDGSYKDKDGKTIQVDPDARDIMLLALCTGMRRGEILRLTWDDLDSDRGFITIRDPKGGKDQTIPMPAEAEAVFKARPRLVVDGKVSPHVFPGRKGGHREGIRKPANAIKAAAGLPKDFRPVHGLRHVFASMLASSGEVDMYVLQKLLTHKSPLMTMRYSHLRDEALRAASNVAGRIISGEGA